MTHQGQDEVAKFCKIVDKWKKYNDENSEASLVRKYFDLLVLVKSKSSNDKYGLLFGKDCINMRLSYLHTCFPDFPMRKAYCLNTTH